MNTKVWIVESNRSYHFGSSTPVGFFLSKEEAEFFVWTKNKEQRESIHSCFYSVRVISSLAAISDTKKYKEFLKAKLLQAEKECGELFAKRLVAENERKAAEEERSYYQKLLEALN